ncbi:YiiX/YebB-like N1pC/P60 family cysteine hydrolase [Acidicapsa dinghuensis]|uniref:YiiX/YebB-like N1pC/P60 family cysteine hydrolase n=1 Tax=Acidicapsa dinghuensis TaxID=2218256 RepID=A0ABW1EE82_9BACT|nr:YiiX/YebB-like N1pC/P60 family cysteine hydrolase [Acidicapsa dinghuensis]
MIPSTKTELSGLRRLNDAVLAPGDIILTTTTAAVSKTIRVATRSDISHAMVYVEDRSVMDATGEGVHARNTQRLYFEDECAVHVMRPRGGISPTQLATIVTYVRGQVGAEYSTKEAVLTALGGARTWTSKQFCSRLVAQAFESAGIALVPDPNYCSPADIKNSPLLVPVGNSTVMVSAKEAAFWEDIEDVPQRMRDAINTVLLGARRHNPTIQTFDDIHAHLIQHPEDDVDFCQLLQISGYLSIWAIEKEKNPWQYDLELLSAGPADSVEEYCWSVLKNEQAGPNRYFVNRGGYRLFTLQSDLKFFQVMLDLYEHLASLHRTRVDIAAKWLEANGRLPQQASSHLMPHSPEWFTVLERWDLPQAMMTRRVLELAGNPNVCSICGDDPAQVYYLPARHRSAGGVDTLRLCSDCLEIRHGMGEPFIPLDGSDC